MIRHTVLFKLKPYTSQTEVEGIFTDVLSLTNDIPGILSLTGGKCYFREKNTLQGFTHGFSIDFQDEIARNAFLKESVANPLRERIEKVTTDGAKGIIGFDFGEWG